MDSDASGKHRYIDIGRLDPQSLYLKYWRAFSEQDSTSEGMKEMLLEQHNVSVGEDEETLHKLFQTKAYKEAKKNLTDLFGKVRFSRKQNPANYIVTKNPEGRLEYKAKNQEEKLDPQNVIGNLMAIFCGFCKN